MMAAMLDGDDGYLRVKRALMMGTLYADRPSYLCTIFNNGTDGTNDSVLYYTHICIYMWVWFGSALVEAGTSLKGAMTCIFIL